MRASDEPHITRAMLRCRAFHYAADCHCCFRYAYAMLTSPAFSCCASARQCRYADAAAFFAAACQRLRAIAAMLAPVHATRHGSA